MALLPIRVGIVWLLKLNKGAQGETSVWGGGVWCEPSWFAATC